LEERDKAEEGLRKSGESGRGEEFALHCDEILAELLRNLLRETKRKR